jgi:hypothetical protein
VPATAPTTSNPAQQRVLDLLGRGTGDEAALAITTEVIDEVRAELDDALDPLAPDLGDEPLVVTKHALSTVHGCEAHHLAQKAEPFAWSTATARGQVAHKAIELGVHWRGEPNPSELVDEAVAVLIERDAGLGGFLGALTTGEHAQLHGEATAFVATFLERFPTLKKEWWPVTESGNRVELVGGLVHLRARTDLTLGKPNGLTPTKVIIDLKSGQAVTQHREDLRFYALIEALAVGVPPRKVATFYLEQGRAQPEDVTADLLRAAAARTVDGVHRMVELERLGRPARRRPGATCRWCPLATGCDEGIAHLRGRAEADGLLDDD